MEVQIREDRYQVCDYLSLRGDNFCIECHKINASHLCLQKIY